MTKVQQRVTALIAAFVFAVGCLFVASTPQQAYATANTKLVAGNSFSAATNLSLNKDKSLAGSNYTKFNNTNDNNFYKFTTSDRNSRYRLTLRTYDGWRLYATIYDATHHRIAHVATSSTTGQSWYLKNLKRGEVYYVEVWRYINNVNSYIDSGFTLDESYADSNYVPYRITMKEVVTAPRPVTALKARSTTRQRISVSWRESNTADGYRVEVKKGSGAWKYAGYTTNTSYTVKNLSSASKYKVRVRAARWVAGKKYYSKYATVSKAFKPNGNQTKWVR